MVEGEESQRYGKLYLNEDEMSEYVFYVNLGSSMSSVLQGLAVSSGFAGENPIIV